MFRAPQWHGATQPHSPPRPRKSAWHCDITDVIRHTVCPHTSSNPITRYLQSSRSPATRRVYASMFRAPQWHGATQTHFPPRPRKSASHCDITNVTRPLSPAPKSSFPCFTGQVCVQLQKALSRTNLYYKLATFESNSEKLFPALDLYYTNWPLLISHLHFAPLTRTISAQGCAGQVQHAISPAFRAPDTHDLRRGLPAKNPKRSLTCTSRPRHARSPQRAAPDRDKTHSRLHFAPSTRTISAEGRAGPGQNALSPAFRALDRHDLRRGLRRTETKRVPSTRTISAEGYVSWCSGGTAPGLKRESKEEREVKM